MSVRRATAPPTVAAVDDGSVVVDLTGLRMGTSLYVGRGRACQIRLNDPSVARLHAELRHTPAGWLLIDREAAGGTWRRGRRATRALVGPGDDLRFGTVPVRLA